MIMMDALKWTLLMVAMVIVLVHRPTVTAARPKDECRAKHNPCAQDKLENISVNLKSSLIYRLPKNPEQGFTMCMTGTFGPPETDAFILRFLDGDTPISNFVALVLSSNVILEDYSQGNRTSFTFNSPYPFPFEPSHTFYLSVKLKMEPGNKALQYRLCRDNLRCRVIEHHITDLAFDTTQIISDVNITTLTFLCPQHHRQQQ